MPRFANNKNNIAIYLDTIKFAVIKNILYYSANLIDSDETFSCEREKEIVSSSNIQANNASIGVIYFDDIVLVDRL